MWRGGRCRYRPGDPEFDENEREEQALDAQVLEVSQERAAEGPGAERRSFWARLFGKKS